MCVCVCVCVCASQIISFTDLSLAAPRGLVGGEAVDLPVEGRHLARGLDERPAQLLGLARQRALGRRLLGDNAALLLQPLPRLAELASRTPLTSAAWTAEVQQLCERGQHARAGLSERAVP